MPAYPRDRPVAIDSVAAINARSTVRGKWSEPIAGPKSPVDHGQVVGVKKMIDRDPEQEDFRRPDTTVPDRSPGRSSTDRWMTSAGETDTTRGWH